MRLSGGFMVMVGSWRPVAWWIAWSPA